MAAVSRRRRRRRRGESGESGVRAQAHVVPEQECERVLYVIAGRTTAIVERFEFVSHLVAIPVAIPVGTLISFLSFELIILF